MEDLRGLPESLANQVILLVAFTEYLLDGFKGLVLCYADGHVIVFLIDAVINFVLDDDLILAVAKVEEDTLVVPAFGAADEVLAVLDGAEEDLHALVEVEESLDRGVTYHEGGCGRLRIAVGHVGSVVFEVLLHLHLQHLATGLVEGLPLERTLIESVVVGLDEEHVLFEHADILETA
jgi:hypothetical protein